MATARLRKAFQYPDDSGSEEQGREDLDEEEQELVISRLKAQNDRQNIGYSVIFSAIPLLPGAILALLAFSGSLSQPDRLFSFLSLLSLIVTACIMNFSPSQCSDKKGLVLRPWALAVVLRFAVPINAAICGLLLLVYMMGAQIRPSPSIQMLIYIVPGVMFASIMAVRHAMTTVEFRQLEDLRYEYKGA